MGDDIEGEAARDRAGAQKSISLSDDGLTLAVGSLLNDDSGSNQGKVRVYEYKSGSWSQIGSDILGGDANNDYLGGSLELSSDGKTIVISSDSHNGDGTD